MSWMHVDRDGDSYEVVSHIWKMQQEYHGVNEKD